MSEPATILDPFKETIVPLDPWVDQGLRWLVDNYRPFFQAIKWPVDQMLEGFDWALNSVPPTLMIIFFALVAWQIAGGTPRARDSPHRWYASASSACGRRP